MKARKHLSSVSDDNTPRVPLQWPRLASSFEKAPPRYRSIPEDIAKLAYEQYSYLYGEDQSFERLHQRGGFGVLELIGLLADLIERERDAR